MASVKVGVISGENNEEKVKIVLKADLSKQVPKHLKPREVCELYFNSCRNQDNDTWLACLHTDIRSESSFEKRGPFSVCNWYLGRSRVEKYEVNYKFLSEALPIREGFCTTVTCVFAPLYGPVPGYKKGSQLAPDIKIVLQQTTEGDDKDLVWRIIRGTF